MEDSSFRPVPGYEGLYSISPNGLVWVERRFHSGQGRHYGGCGLKPVVNPRWKHLQVNLWRDRVGRTFPLHRLVALVFVPNPEALEFVCWRDHDRHNVRAANLYWSDTPEHRADSWERRAA